MWFIINSEQLGIYYKYFKILSGTKSSSEDTKMTVGIWLAIPGTQLQINLLMMLE